MATSEVNGASRKAQQEIVEEGEEADTEASSSCAAVPVSAESDPAACVSVEKEKASARESECPTSTAQSVKKSTKRQESQEKAKDKTGGDRARRKRKHSHSPSDRHGDKNSSERKSRKSSRHRSRSPDDSRHRKSKSKSKSASRSSSSERKENESEKRQDGRSSRSSSRASRERSAKSTDDGREIKQEPQEDPDAPPVSLDVDYGGALCVFYTQSPFSDFTRAPFILEGKYYYSVEHYFQIQMLYSFGLFKLAHEAIQIEDAKEFRKKLRNDLKAMINTGLFDEKTFSKWKDGNAIRLLKKANRAKFDQNYKFRELLMHTGDRLLIFTNKNDIRLGVGMSESEFLYWIKMNKVSLEDLLDYFSGVRRRPRQLGWNTLGYTLMDVRAEYLQKPSILVDWQRAHPDTWKAPCEKTTRPVSDYEMRKIKRIQKDVEECALQSAGENAGIKSFDSAPTPLSSSAIRMNQAFSTAAPLATGEPGQPSPSLVPDEKVVVVEPATTSATGASCGSVFKVPQLDAKGQGTIGLAAATATTSALSSTTTTALSSTAAAALSSTTTTISTPSSSSVPTTGIEGSSAITSLSVTSCPETFSYFAASCNDGIRTGLADQSNSAANEMTEKGVEIERLGKSASYSCKDGDAATENEVVPCDQEPAVVTAISSNDGDVATENEVVPCDEEHVVVTVISPRDDDEKDQVVVIPTSSRNIGGDVATENEVASCDEEEPAVVTVISPCDDDEKEEVVVIPTSSQIDSQPGESGVSGTVTVDSVPSTSSSTSPPSSSPGSALPHIEIIHGERRIVVTRKDSERKVIGSVDDKLTVKSTRTDKERKPTRWATQVDISSAVEKGADVHSVTWEVPESADDLPRTLAAKKAILERLKELKFEKPMINPYAIGTAAILDDQGLENISGGAELNAKALEPEKPQWPPPGTPYLVEKGEIPPDGVIPPPPGTEGPAYLLPLGRRDWIVRPLYPVRGRPAALPLELLPAPAVPRGVNPYVFQQRFRTPVEPGMRVDVFAPEPIHIRPPLIWAPEKDPNDRKRSEWHPPENPLAGTMDKARNFVQMVRDRLKKRAERRLEEGANPNTRSAQEIVDPDEMEDPIAFCKDIFPFGMEASLMDMFSMGFVPPPIVGDPEAQKRNKPITVSEWRHFMNHFKSPKDALMYFADQWVMKGRLNTMGEYEHASDDAKSKFDNRRYNELGQEITEENDDDDDDAKYRRQVDTQVIYVDTSQYDEYVRWYQKVHGTTPLPNENDTEMRMDMLRSWYQYYQNSCRTGAEDEEDGGFDPDYMEGAPGPEQLYSDNYGEYWALSRWKWARWERKVERGEDAHWLEVNQETFADDVSVSGKPVSYTPRPSARNSPDSVCSRWGDDDQESVEADADAATRWLITSAARIIGQNIQGFFNEDDDIVPRAVPDQELMEEQPDHSNGSHSQDSVTEGEASSVQHADSDQNRLPDREEQELIITESSGMVDDENAIITIGQDDGDDDDDNGNGGDQDDEEANGPASPCRTVLID